MKLPPRRPTLYFKDFQDRLTAQHVEAWFKTLALQISQAQSQEDWEKSIIHWNELKCHLDTHLEVERRD